jgi:hypothetical protein
MPAVYAQNAAASTALARLARGRVAGQTLADRRGQRRACSEGAERSETHVPFLIARHRQQRSIATGNGQQRERIHDVDANAAARIPQQGDQCLPKPRRSKALDRADRMQPHAHVRVAERAANVG